MSYSIFNNSSLNNVPFSISTAVANQDQKENAFASDVTRYVDDQNRNLFSSQISKKRLRDFEGDSPNKKRLCRENSTNITRYILPKTNSESSSDSGQLDDSVFDEFFSPFDSNLIDQLDQLDCLDSSDSPQNEEVMCIDAPKVPGRLIEALEEQPVRHIRDLERRRAECPITKKAIELQAQLIKVSSEVKAWAIKQPALYPLGKSLNDVYKLNSLKSNIELAFFKRSANDNESLSIIEKLMWDVSLILGLEEMFVPTGFATIETLSKQMKGSIQPAQKGKVLNDFLDDKINPLRLEKNDFQKAILTTFVFGMGDAHGNNVFINNQKKILFFDNSRSLPHSNGFIVRDELLVPAYRSCLLDLPQCKDPISNLDLQNITNIVNSWESRLPSLKNYLNSTTVNRLIRHLPETWFNVDQILESMQKRITQLQEVLQRNPPNNMLELVDNANPDYRLTYALTFADLYLKKQSTEFIHNEIGFETIEDLTQNIINAGYSVYNLKTIALNRRFSWDEMCFRIEEELNKKSNKTRLELTIFKIERNHLLKELFDRSKVDNKDVDNDSLDLF